MRKVDCFYDHIPCLIFLLSDITYVDKYFFLATKLSGLLRHICAPKNHLTSLQNRSTALEAWNYLIRQENIRFVTCDIDSWASRHVIQMPLLMRILQYCIAMASRRLLGEFMRMTSKEALVAARLKCWRYIMKYHPSSYMMKNHPSSEALEEPTQNCGTHLRMQRHEHSQYQFQGKQEQSRE